MSAPTELGDWWGSRRPTHALTDAEVLRDEVIEASSTAFSCARHHLSAMEQKIEDGAAVKRCSIPVGVLCSIPLLEANAIARIASEEMDILIRVGAPDEVGQFDYLVSRSEDVAVVGAFLAGWFACKKSAALRGHPGREWL